MSEQKQAVKKIIEYLKEYKQTIAFAESCTGGRIAAVFTAIPGVSSVFNGSCVTYSNETKHQWLGISSDILDTYGAVSSECVTTMLEGIRSKAESDYAIAVSGIAGPDGGTELKPVGTVYIGILTPTKSLVKKYAFHGDRESVQSQATTVAINLFEESLKISK